MTGPIDAPGALAALCLGACLALGVLLAAWAFRRRRRVTRRRLDPFRAPRETPERYQARRDELLATLGHELRSPLRALLALLETDAALDPDRRGELRALAAHALRVAEDSLDFALLERGAVRLRPAPLDLEDLLAEVLAVVRPLRGDGVALELDVAPGLPLVRRGDGARLKQILVNLVSNALAHTAHGAVRISTGPVEPDEPAGPVRFVVRDSGTGMTPAERQRAFLPFEQGDAPRGRAGIGLAVVASLVDAMDGEVFLESEPGIGSRFVVEVTLPALEPAADGAGELGGRLVGLCCEHPTDARAVAAQLQHWDAEVLRFETADALDRHLRAGCPLDALVLALESVPAPLANALAERETRSLPIARSTPEEAAARLPGALLAALTRHPEARPRAGAGFAGLEVLVVDDHPVVRRVLQAILGELGCRVTCAEDGASAAEIAADPEERFDWVLLDRRMPGLDGLATAALLREAEATRAARIALLVNEAGDDPGGTELFDQVLVRPQQPQALRNLLALTLGEGRRRERPGQSRREDDDLAALRDETLREDLLALTAALERDDEKAVGDHLHRMEGALRLCPDATLVAALRTIETAIQRGDGESRQALRAFADHLAAS